MFKKLKNFIKGKAISKNLSNIIIKMGKYDLPIIETLEHKTSISHEMANTYQMDVIALRDMDPKSVISYLQLSSKNRILGNTSAYGMIIAAKHGNVGCNFKLGLLYYYFKKYNEMIKHLKIASDYGIVMATRMLCDYYVTQKRFYNAITLGKKLYEDNKNVTAYYIGNLYEWVANYDAAIVYYNRAFEDGDARAKKKLNEFKHCAQCECIIN